MRRTKKHMYSTGTTYDRVPTWSTPRCLLFTANLQGWRKQEIMMTVQTT